MKTVLVFIGHYLPGDKGGGPVRSLANLAGALGDEVVFSVITRDRDLGDHRPYPGVHSGEWIQVGKARVLYVSPFRYAFGEPVRIAARTRYDVLYLNSFFEIATVYTLAFRRLGLGKDKPVVVAPRGEFSRGALELKKWKKAAYLSLCRFFRVYRDITWIAASQAEYEEIRSVVGRDACVAVTPNLASSPPVVAQVARTKRAGSARVVFVSRIARMKNLDYALRLLSAVQGQVEFDIYGPAEDLVYLSECQAIAATLPSNIVCRYHGRIHNSHVAQVLSASHLFLLPTRGENYSHAIVEALGAGCPVLISDRTPWRGLATYKAGWDCPLEQPERFVEALSTLVAMDNDEFTWWSKGARLLAASVAGDGSRVQAHRKLFADLLGGF